MADRRAGCLDLFRGEITRVHEDIEIAVPAGGFPVVREALSELEFDVVGDGQLRPLNGPTFDVTHQTWGRDPSTGLYCLDVFREPHSGGTWIYRRDERVRLSYASVISRTAEGIPFMAPEIVLLFKAKHVRETDEFDFTGMLPLLSADRRAWLIEALRLVHPEHLWSAVLEGCG